MHNIGKLFVLRPYVALFLDEHLGRPQDFYLIQDSFAIVTKDFKFVYQILTQNGILYIHKRALGSWLGNAS